MRWRADAVISVAAGLALGGYAVFLLFDESLGWGLAAALGSLMLLASGFLSRSALCPACGAEFKVVTIGGSVHRCAGCGHYFRMQEGGLVPVSPDAVEAAPSFAVRLDALGQPPGWNWPWPERCCVCGAPAVRQDDFRVTLGTGFAAGGMMVQTTTWTLRIPYCAEHRDGVANGSDFDADNISHAAILFRSYAFYHAFCEANGLKRKSPSHRT